MLAYCVLCIAYSAANLYSHLKSGLRIWVAFRIPYSVFLLYSGFHIPFSVLRALWVASVFRIPYPYSVLGALLVAFHIPYSASAGIRIQSNSAFTPVIDLLMKLGWG